MKKYIIYIALLAVGLLLGWLLFGNSSNTEQHDHTEETVVEHWTCSMHPQIDLPEFGPCPICGMDLIPMTQDDSGLLIDSFRMSENAIALANIETIVIGNSEYASKILTLSGKISTNDKVSAVQTAHFGGRIEKLYYKTTGEFVNKGSLIANIYSPELVTAQNELIEALNIKESQPELYKAVRNKLKYWKISEKQILSIERNKKVISNFNVYANVSGYIADIYVVEGNHVKEGTPLFNVANLGSVWAVFDVYEQDIKNIKIGQSIAISLNAFPDKVINTRIDYIDPVLNSTTRTVSARATILNNDNSLKPGMLITSSLEIGSKSKKNTVIVIPKTAVLWTGKRSVVYVKPSKGEPVFEMREVDLGNESSENYEILSGLESGEELVINGAFTVDAAAQLSGKKSMMNRNKKTDEN
jgi:Cu(I)/Ag(I) efflux system membrane fusion protein